MSYDPGAPGNGAQLLFDHVDDAKHLKALWEWLSRNNVDANVVPHTEIRAAVAAGGDPFSVAAAKCWKE